MRADRDRIATVTEVQVRRSRRLDGEAVAGLERRAPAEARREPSRSVPSSRYTTTDGVSGKVPPEWLRMSIVTVSGVPASKIACSPSRSEQRDALDHERPLPGPVADLPGAVGARSRRRHRRRRGADGRSLSASLTAAPTAATCARSSRQRRVHGRPGRGQALARPGRRSCRRAALRPRAGHVLAPYDARRRSATPRRSCRGRTLRSPTTRLLARRAAARASPRSDSSGHVQSLPSSTMCAAWLASASWASPTATLLLDLSVPQQTHAVDLDGAPSASRRRSRTRAIRVVVERDRTASCRSQLLRFFALSRRSSSTRVNCWYAFTPPGCCRA